MEALQKTLISIASVSHGVANAIAKHAGTNSPESLQLQRIVVASQALLEMLNTASVFGESILDDRLIQWLSTKEPGMCLETLLRMEELLVVGLTPKRGVGLGLGVQNLFRAAMSPPMKTRINEAYLIFLKRRDCFHFLTEPRIWNREQGVHQQPGAVRASPGAEGEAVEGAPWREDQRRVNSVDAINRTRQRTCGIDLQKMESLLQWLDGLNCREKQENTHDLRQPDTCTWLLKMRAYKTWRDGEKSFLWLNGKPGAGKSVMAAAVIEDLKSSLQEDETLAYFFCDFRNERSTSAAGAMRSLLWQLLKQLRGQNVYPRELVDDLVEEKDGGASTLTNAKRLVRHVSRAIKQFPSPPLVIIDALDECEEVEELLNALAELRNDKIRLFVTSRPLEVIKDSFSKLPLISMDEMNYELLSDIRLHVTRELDSHRRLRNIDVSFKDEIRSKLCDRADGMFRWVQCQIDTLKGCATVLDVRKAMDSLPSGLEETYTRILRAIDKESSEGRLALRALVWLVAALRPLKLKEIVEGLTINLQQRTLDREIGPMHGPVLLDALGSLVTHDEETDIVILSHFSVKEYLIGTTTRTELPTYHINPEHAHAQLAQFCMCYISVCLRSMEQSTGGKPRPIRPSHSDNAAVAHHHRMSLSHSWLLLPYVFLHGFEHLTHVGRGQIVVVSAITSLSADVQANLLEWERLYTERSHHVTLLHRYPPPDWPIARDDFVPYVLVCFASEPLLRTSFTRISFKSRDGMNPLVWAAYLGKVEHSKALFWRGAKLSHAARYPSGLGVDGHSLPLEAAVCSEKSVLVNFFLDQGSPVPQGLFEDIVTGRLKYNAYVVTRLIQTDEFVEWATNFPREDLLRGALQYPSPEHVVESWIQTGEAMVTRRRRLMQIGCDLSAHDSLKETHLRKSASAGHISEVENMLSQIHAPLPHDIILDASRSGQSNPEIIRLVLRRGCNPFAISADEDTAFHIVIGSCVSEDDCLESIEILNDAGCDPSVPNLADLTPVHTAARRGYIYVVERLLCLGALLPSNVLLTAAAASWPAKRAPTIRSLCRMGADIHAVEPNGDTVLHNVLEYRGEGLEADCLESTQFLIESGCSPLASNSLCETPLHVAARGGYILVVDYLLSLGIPLPSHVLLAASRIRHSNGASMIRFLLGKGADAHVSSSEGDNALHIAIRETGTSESYAAGPEIVRTLIRAGCDPCMRNSAGETSFHTAARYGCIAIMEYLLSRGTLFPSDIIFAAGPSWSPEATMRFLIERGAVVGGVSANGDTVLHLVARCGSVELAQLLVEGGCGYHTLNSSRETPLHIAALYGHISMVKYLVSLDETIPSDILLAASGRYSRPFSLRAPVIKIFLDKGAGINVDSADGETPMHCLLYSELWLSPSMIEDDNVASIKILHNAGCRLGGRGADGRTLMQAVVRVGHIRIVEYLLSQDIPLPPDILLAFGSGATRGCLSVMVRFLISKGADVHAVAPNGDTVLHLVLASGTPWNTDLEYVTLLVGLGCKPSVCNLAGETPLHVATRNSPLSVVKYLLSQCASLPSNILLSAVRATDTSARPEMFRFLILEGADVHAVTPDGNTPLHLILLLGDFTSEYQAVQHWKIVQILLESGCDHSTRNTEGQTSFDLAEAKGPGFKQNFLRLVDSCRISTDGR